MTKDVFLAAIQAASAVAASAVSHLSPTAFASPTMVSDVASAAFDGCFNQIVKAIEDGHLATPKAIAEAI